MPQDRRSGRERRSGWRSTHSTQEWQICNLPVEIAKLKFLDNLELLASDMRSDSTMAFTNNSTASVEKNILLDVLLLRACEIPTQIRHKA